MWCGVDVTGTCQTSGVRHVSLFAGSAPLSCFLAISTHSGSRGSPRCSLVVFPSSPSRRAVLVETQDRCRVHAEPLLGPRWPRWRVWASDLWNRDLHSRREAICAPKIFVFGGGKRSCNAHAQAECKQKAWLLEWRAPAASRRLSSQRSS